MAALSIRSLDDEHLARLINKATRLGISLNRISSSACPVRPRSHASPMENSMRWRFPALPRKPKSEAP